RIHGPRRLLRDARGVRAPRPTEHRGPAGPRCPAHRPPAGHLSGDRGARGGPRGAGPARALAARGSGGARPPPRRRDLRLRADDPAVPARPRGAPRAPGVRARRDLRDPPPTLEHRRPVRPAGPPHGRAHRLSHPGPSGPAGHRRQSGVPAVRRVRRGRRPGGRPRPGGGVMLEGFFKLREHGSTAGTEVLAGLTTFMVMAYIIFVNPAILSFAGVPALQPQGVPFAPTLAATCLVAALATAAMGLVANYPLAL